MSLLVKPNILVRSCGCLVRHAPLRSFSVANRAFVQAGQPHRASTALKTNVRESEERSAASVQVVGDEVKGAEGAHYQGECQCN